MIHCSQSHCFGASARCCSRPHCWHSSMAPPSSWIKRSVGQYVLVIQAYRQLGLKKRGNLRHRHTKENISTVYI